MRTVQKQIDALHKSKDKIKYEYHELCEDNGLKQATLESYQFTQQTVKTETETA